jgi:hypothetical protein
MTWGGWEDDLSGLRMFVYEVHEMTAFQSSLKENKNWKNGNVNLSTPLVRTFIDSVISEFLKAKCILKKK